MLDPEILVDAIVSTIQSIPEVIVALVGDPNRIAGFHYREGIETTLTKAVYEMVNPSVLIAWSGTQAGNFDGATLFKHVFKVYIRAGNQAGEAAPIGPGNLWWLIANKPVNSDGLNIRQVNIVPQVEIMDVPGISHGIDEMGMDLFTATITLPEIGDN